MAAAERSVLAVLPSFGRLGTSPASARLLRRGRLLAAGLCLLLAGVTALGSSRAHPRGRAPLGTRVLVAARDLPAGRVLARADLTQRSWPRVLPPATAVRLADALGNRLASPLRRGEPLTTTRLTSGRLTTGLPAGSVAVSVPLAGSTSGVVHAGDQVDLIPLSTADFPAAPVAAGPARPPDVVARHLTVLATIPAAADGSDERVIVGTSRGLAVRLAGLSAAHEFAVVVDSF